MAAIAWSATLYPSTWEFWLESHSQTFESGFDRSMQVLDLGVPRWRGRGTWRRKGHAGGAMDALLARIAGPQNLVLMPNFARLSPDAGTHADWLPDQTFPQPFSDLTFFSDGTGFTVTTSPPVATGSAADRGATSITVAGFRPGGLYRAGEHFGVSDGTYERLYMLVADATADGNGTATFTFRPGLRAPLAMGAAINITNPTSPMRLINDQQARHSIVKGPFYTHEFEFVEDLASLP